MSDKLFLTKSLVNLKRYKIKIDLETFGDIGPNNTPGGTIRQGRVLVLTVSLKRKKRYKIKIDSGTMNEWVKDPKDKLRQIENFHKVLWQE